MYFVVKAVKLVSDGRVSCAVSYFSSIDAAKKKFHQDLYEDINNAQFSYTMEAILDERGRVVMSESWTAPITPEVN